MTGVGKTFLTSNKPKFLDIPIEVVGSLTETYLNIKGTNDFENEVVRINNSTFKTFGNLGTLNGITLQISHLRLADYDAGFTLNNVVVKGDDIEYSGNAGSIFMTIDNLLINPTPITVSLTELKPILPTDAFGFNINPATPIQNTILITEAAKIVGGGKTFVPDTFNSAKITAFGSQTNGNVKAADPGTGGAGFTKITSDISTGLANGEKISIFDTILYDGTFTISNFISGGGFVDDVFDINIAYGGSEAGSWNRLGDTPTIVLAPGNTFTNGNKVTINGSINYNGTFIITVITPFVDFSIVKAFVANDAVLTGDILATQVRDITSFVVTPNIVEDNILIQADNGFGGTTITVNEVIFSNEYINGRRVKITQTGNYNGSFRIFNVNVGAKTFDIQTPFITNEGNVLAAISMQLTKLTLDNHELNTGEAALVDNSIDYDEGGILRADTVNDVTIDIPFDPIAVA